MATQQIDLGQEAVNLSKRLYWCETLGFGAITKFLDPFGDETDDEAEAVVAIVKTDAAKWLALDLRDFDRSRREH